MKNNFILQLVTKETGEQAAFQKMLVQENVSFRLLCNGSYNETIDCAIKYETLLLYEFMNW